jgi:hypothetical protein
MESAHMQRWHVSGEVQIKMTVGHHCRLSGWIKILNNHSTKCWQGCAAQELSHIAGGNAKWYSYSEGWLGTFFFPVMSFELIVVLRLALYQLEPHHQPF